MVSPYSSESIRRLRGVLVLAFVLIMAGVSGCVTVRPEDKEFLAHPAMTFGSRGESEGQEAHVLGNREGSAGGSAVEGGGCGCN